MILFKMKKKGKKNVSWHDTFPIQNDQAYLLNTAAPIFLVRRYITIKKEATEETVRDLAIR